MIDRICENCVHFYNPRDPQAGICRRYPQDVDKTSQDTCGEFSPDSKILSDEMLATSVFAPGGFSSTAMGTFRRNGIRTFADLIDCGRTSLRFSDAGFLDREAIKEVAAKLLEFGVQW